MSYKMELVLNVTTESKQDADRLAHRIMVGMENNAENYDGVLSALATRSSRSEVYLNMPKETQEMNIQVCEDCNSYDDANMEDSFMVPFGEDMWLCELCLEARGEE